MGSLNDDISKILKAFNCFISEIRGEHSSDASKRHIIAVIMKTLSDEVKNEINDYSTILTFEDVQTSLSPEDVQEITSNLINLIIYIFSNNISDIIQKLRVNVGIYKSKQVQKDEKIINTLHIINLVCYFFKNCFDIDILSDEEKIKVEDYFTKTTDSIVPQCEQVLEEFTAVVSELLRNNTLKLVSLDKNKSLDLDGETVFIWQANLEFERRVIEKYVIPRMKTVSKMTTLISELAAADALHSTDKSTHPISYYGMNGHKKRLYSYSIKSAFFDRDIFERVRGFKFEHFYVKGDKKPETLLPLLINSRNAVVGKEICYENTDNNHIFVTGQSGYGKSYTLCQLAASCLVLKHRVVVFDTSDSFTEMAMKENLPPEFVDKYVKLINIGDEEIPVNLFRIDTSCNKYKQQTEAFDIINAGIHEMSDSAQNVVNSALPLMIDRNSNGTLPINELPDILQDLECNPQTLESLKSKLKPTLDAINLLGMSNASWDIYFNGSPKIIVIRVDSGAFTKGNPLVEMMLTSLYHYQSKNDTTAIDIFIDEIQNQRFDDASPIKKIMKEGRKKHIAFIGATQDYYSRNTPIGSVMGKADTIISLKPASNTADLIAKELRLTNEEKVQFDDMERGDIFIKGNLYSSEAKRNVGCIIFGKLCSFKDYLLKVK